MGEDVFFVECTDRQRIRHCLLPGPLESDQLIEEATVVSIVVVIERIFEYFLGVRERSGCQLTHGPLAIFEQSTDCVQLEEEVFVNR